MLTPKGSVPTEPEKGCDIQGAIDKHPSIGIPLLTREIWDALTIWEPRIVLQKVTVAMTEFSRFSTSVFWRPIESVLDDLRVTEVTYQWLTRSSARWLSSGRPARRPSSSATRRC